MSLRNSLTYKDKNISIYNASNVNTIYMKCQDLFSLKNKKQSKKFKKKSFERSPLLIMIGALRVNTD